MKLKLLKSLLLLAMPCMTVQAQDINMKFGKPTKEELQMTTYAADPEAEAVML